PPTPPALRPAATRIVGVGASAGGLESLERLFGALPADTGMAFVVVQHLSPDFKSLMDELIGRYSDMPVVVAENGTLVEPNHMYLMPSRKEMIIRERRLVLTDKDPHAFSLPIDKFFRSLAQDVGREAVGVVLSGSGSDGSRGIIDIDHADGLVLAETAASAKFDGMPLSALETGVVDHCHTPTDLARVLCGLPPLAPAGDVQVLSDDPLMDMAFRLLRDGFGIDFSLYKIATVARRIQRRIDILQLGDLTKDLERLQVDPQELNALYQDLLIGVTQFFRDPDAFELLLPVIDEIVANAPADQELRVWTAACATGEEAYSIAIMFHEAIARRGRPLNLKILATDVHQISLDHAGLGVYGEAQLGNVSPERLARYFIRRSSGYQIVPDLRQLIVFARHNVTKDPPFTRMSFISCRNLLIYLQPQAQRTVLSLFHFGLVSNGVLFLGASETPGGLSDEFLAIDEHWKLFRKRRDVQLLGQVRLSLQPRPTRRPAIALDVPRVHGPDPLMLATYDQLLDRYMPPGFLLDEDRVLIDSFAGAEKFLKQRARRPSPNILDLVDDDLRSILSGAIARTLKERAPVAYSGVKFATADGELHCTLNAEPLLHPRTGARHVLVTFREGKEGPRDSSTTPIPMGEAAQDRLDTLELELAQSRETLQATIEELETSNEEMQATNEELVASNEELQSTNEELHSVNEELYTVNAEYQHKIAELKELNADMQHLLEGTDVGTVFLDRELRIRRFTSRIASVFRFQEHDIGREIGDFSHNIERDQLMNESVAVRRTGIVVEDEVRDRTGVPFFLRILPYRMNQRAERADGELTPPARNGNGTIDGVVLTLTEMTALDKARSRLDQLSAIVASSDDAIVGKSLDGTITAWNRGAQMLYGYTAEEALGNNVSMLMSPGTEGEFARFLDRVRRGERIEHVQSLRQHKDGSPLNVSVTISPIYDRQGT
ncbi:MAG: PAS domain S-box protein, partial [Deltaproteobacteria bacterium]|nr:PAS domain S-box protein [Deltaproteobacteria bacterium]